MDPTRSLDIGDYKIVFENEQAGPQLTILKNDKTLKSVPALIRKTAEYKELKQHFDEAKKQYSRIRRRLEEMMAYGEDLTAKDLTILKTLPAGQNLLESLILRTADGHYGLLNFT